MIFFGLLVTQRKMKKSGFRADTFGSKATTNALVMIVAILVVYENEFERFSVRRNKEQIDFSFVGRVEQKEERSSFIRFRFLAV